MAVVAGSPACLKAAGVTFDPETRAALARVLDAGDTPVLVAVGTRPVAVAGFGDPLRSDAPKTVKALTAAGWEVGILSGDHPKIVAAVGATLGIPQERCRGALSPEEKLKTVRQGLSGGPVVMVGDGVNDAAALAAASVGIGVHGGSEATLAAADVFFSKPGTLALLGLLALSRSTLRRIRLNLGISLTYNVIAAALAAAGVISPLLAAILMPLSSLGVIANSYRGRLTWN
jgi:Cu2+-exporting ATPase